MASYNLIQPARIEVTGQDVGLAHWRAVTQPESELDSLDERTKFFFHLGFAINRWAFVERELYAVFRFLFGAADEAAVAYLFYKQPTLGYQFDMTDTLVEALLTEPHKTRWDNPIAKSFRKHISLRNRLAHDPSTQVVSGIGFTGSAPPAATAVPPPTWELHVQSAKLKQPKRPASTKPVTISELVEHIEAVTQLQEDLIAFRERLPKRLSKRPSKPPRPRPVRTKAKSKKTARSRARP